MITVETLEIDIREAQTALDRACAKKLDLQARAKMTQEEAEEHEKVMFSLFGRVQALTALRNKEQLIQQQQKAADPDKHSGQQSQSFPTPCRSGTPEAAAQAAALAAVVPGADQK
jgi:hypothetical protein